VTLPARSLAKTRRVARDARLLARLVTVARPARSLAAAVRLRRRGAGYGSSGRARGQEGTKMISLSGALIALAVFVGPSLLFSVATFALLLRD